MRLTVLAAVLSIAASATPAAACPIPSYDVGYSDGALPPNPTVYFELQGREAWASKSAEAHVDGIAVPVAVRSIRVGYDLIVAVRVPRTEGELYVAVDGGRWGGSFYGTIAASDTRPTSVATLGPSPDELGKPAVALSLSGKGVGYWEIATPRCGTSAELPGYSNGRLTFERAVQRACLAGGELAITAHYLDGSSERLAVPALPRQASHDRAWAWWLALAGLGLGAAAAWLRARRRRPTPVL